PITNPAVAKVNFKIISGGTPQLSVDQTPINFGKVFLTAAKKSLFAIKNGGTASAQITAMTFQGSAYSLDKADPFGVGSTRSAFINVILSTGNLGVFTDTLTINTSTGDVFRIPLYAEVVPQPVISVDVTSIDQALVSGDSTHVTMTVSNTGDGDLE